MAAGHSHALHVHGHSVVHRLAPRAKVAGALALVVSVALTPRDAVWAFGVHAVVVAAVVAAAGLRPGFVAARLVVITPFVVFALLLPFVAGGERIDVVGVAVSRDGALGALNVLAKAGLGATTSIVLAATTTPPDLLRGARRLGVPAVVTTIAAFMLRYVEVVVAELARMRRAMTARAYDPRWLWQVRPIASSAGAVFVRSYERGERVHAAMVARGFRGDMPDLAPRRVTGRDWVLGLAPAAVAGVTLVAAVTGVAG